MSVHVVTTITYRDDKVEEFLGSDTPSIGEKWITLFPLDDTLGRMYIPVETVAKISFTYKS